MTVSHFAPRPPSRSGVTEYAELLHQTLAGSGEIHWGGGSPTRLYHVGNNELHRSIYDEALRHPGVVILHDGVLQHLLLGALDEADYVDEFVYNYGEWSRQLGQKLFCNRSQSGSAAIYFRYPMLRRLAETSLAIVVHNSRAAAMVRQHVATATVVVIPHLVQTPALPPATRGGRPRFGVFGYLRQSKRIRTFLAAAKIAGVQPVLSGDFVDDNYRKALAPTLAEAGVEHTSYLSRQQFAERILSVDAVVSLRSPSVGETSGITVQAMALGRPAIVSDASEGCDYPPGTCASIDEGPAEIENLAAVMQWLSAYPADRLALGGAGRRHVLQHHAPAAVAQQFWHLLKSTDPGMVISN